MKMSFPRVAWWLVIGLLVPIVGGSGCSRQSKKVRHWDRAQEFFQAGQYDQAELEYLNVLRLEKEENPEAIRQLGVIYQAQGKLARAFGFLRKAKELAPEDLEVRAKLAMLHLGLRQITNAQAEIEFILGKQAAHPQALELLADASLTTNAATATLQRLEPLRPQTETNAPYHVALGKLHFRLRDFPRATAAFQRALALDGKCSSAQWGLGSLSLAQTNLADAEQAFQKAEALTPPRSGQRLNYANYKIISGDLEGGRRLLTEMIEKTPDFLPALTRLASLHLAETNYAECEAVLQKVVRQDSMNIEAIMLTARLQMAQGHADKAIAELQKLREMYPGAYAVPYHLAVVQLRQGNLDSALHQLQQAVTLNPDFADAVYLLAELHLRSRDANAAVLLLEDFLKRFPLAARAKYLLAQAFQGAGRPDAALELCGELLARGLTDARIPMFAGLIYRQQDKLNEAITKFEQALEFAPGYYPALQQLVAIDAQAKNLEGALRRVQDQIALRPKHSPLHLLLATIHDAKNDVLAAETALLTAIELNPDTTSPYLALARLYLKSNQGPKALAKMDERLTRNPNDQPALLLKAIIYENLQQFDEARTTYEKLRAINPQSGIVLNNLAYLYCEHFADLDKARDLAQQARTLRPEDPAVADTLGWILFKRGEFAAALPLLQESAGKIGEMAEVQFHLGMAAYMMGQEATATTALQEAAKSGMEFPGKPEAQQRLALLAMSPETTDATAQAVLEKALGERPADPVAARRLGAIHERAGAEDQAIAVYEKALEQNPRLGSLLLPLARLYAQPSRNLDKALELASAAHDLAPQDAHVTHLLGRLAFRAKDHSRALSLLEEIAERLGNNAAVQYDLAWSYYSVGRVAEAALAMQKALRFDSALPQAEDARRFLAMTAVELDPPKASGAAAQIQETLKHHPKFGPALMASAWLSEQQRNVPAARQAAEAVLEQFPLFAPAHKRLATLYVQVPLDYAKAREHALKARESYPADAEVANVFKILDSQRDSTKRSDDLLKEVYK